MWILAHQLSTAARDLLASKAGPDVCVCIVRAKMAHVYHYSSNKAKVPFTSVPDLIRQFRPKTNEHCFVYSGHASGYFIGSQSQRIVYTPDLVASIKRYMPALKLAVFDACYMGTIECLATFCDMARYVIASPTFFGNYSFMESDSFWELGNCTRYSAIRKQSKRLLTDHMRHPLRTYECIGFYDLVHIPALVAALKRAPRPVFSASGKLHRDYWTSVDIYTMFPDQAHVFDKLKNKIVKYLIAGMDTSGLALWAIDVPNSDAWRRMAYKLSPDVMLH